MQRPGWKILFVVILISSVSSIYQAFDTPEELKPSHPAYVSVLILIFEVLTLLSAFCCAFQKVVIDSILFWKSVLAGFVLVNVVVLYIEFSAPGGYKASELAIMVPLSLLFLLLYSLPTYFYYSHDLRKHADGDGEAEVR
ncbi:hypothetical protein [Bowmanella pacifica]|uniref:Uncharacterized protein n=1 Tax=Bowmanella pacifica TaxID=502051 RepID=A0A917YXU9_9ALTE|nr:hypothetical protein [Bowmanella pacifica]GGO67280.1 hypothetical protein GCM10010982_13360 [Bowmanella pacifica]